jgi:predicted nuclease with TOPRIM domain
MDTKLEDILKLENNIHMRECLIKGFICRDENIKKLIAENKKLDAENKKLDAENKKLDAENKKLDAENKKLDAENKKLDATFCKLITNEDPNPLESVTATKIIDNIYYVDGYAIT